MAKNQKMDFLKDFKLLPNRFAEAACRELYNDLAIQDFGSLLRKLKGFIKELESQPSRIESDLVADEVRETLVRNFHKVVPTFYQLIQKTEKQPPTAVPQNIFDYLKIAAFVITEDTSPDRVYEKKQIEFLNIIIQVLSSHGLAPIIASRDDRFIVSYYYKFLKATKTEYRHFSSLTDLEQAVCQPFQNQKAMLINGTLVESKDLLKIRIFETKLNPDEIIYHLNKDNTKKVAPKTFERLWQDPGFELIFPVESNFNEVTNKFLQSPKSPFNLNKIVKQYQIEMLAERHPLVYKRMEEAIVNFEKTGSIRNFIDDLRLSIELMLKELLGNEKSLENQDKPLKEYLNSIGGSGFVRSLFTSTKKTYEDLQNDHVKHADSLTNRDFQFLLNTHFSLLSYLMP